MTTDQSRPSQPSVLETLVANHRRFLAFLEPRVGGREEAEEILQAAFVRAVEKSDGVRDETSAVAWFHRLLRNAIIDHYRRRGAEARAVGVYAARADALGLDEADLEREVCGCFHALLPVLKPEYADVLRRVDLGGTDVASAAAALGVSPGNVRVRLHRARAALRQALERSCRTCATHGCLDCTCQRNSGGSSQP